MLILQSLESPSQDNLKTFDSFGPEVNLQIFIDTSKGQEIIGDKSLYLLRNADTKSKGLGFATAGNFYPDLN